MRVRRSGIWLVLGTGLMVVLLALTPTLVISSVAPDWAPAGLQRWAFAVRLTIGIPFKSLSSLFSGSLSDKQLDVDTAGQTVNFTNQGLNLVGTLYTPPADQTGPVPAIILLHGSSPFGRQLGIYRLLGHRLATAGYMVLSFDQRGYWASDDPPNVDEPADLDFAADVSSAVDYLSAQSAVDPHRIYVIGHSFGGDVALTAARQDGRLRKVVAIGPGRRFIERGGTLDAPEFDYFKQRDTYYMWLDESIPSDIYLNSRARLPLENHLDYFASSQHQPIFLIDGALESTADRQFLAQAFAAMSESKKYLTLPRADHYANVANVGPLILYEEAIMDQLVTEIDTWLREPLSTEKERSSYEPSEPSRGY